MKPVSRKENINKPFTPYLLDFELLVLLFFLCLVGKHLSRHHYLCSLEQLCLSLTFTSVRKESSLCAVCTVMVRVPEQLCRTEGL